MIPSNIRSADLVGHRVKTTQNIMNGAGFVLPAGSIVTIKYVGRSFCIETEKCPCCGVQLRIRNVTRAEVGLLSEEEKNSLRGEDKHD